MNVSTSLRQLASSSLAIVFLAMPLAAQDTTKDSSGAPLSVATPDGYATQNGGTTGGGEAQPITVSTAEAFKSAVSGEKPAVVVVEGQFEIGSVNVGPNKTIIGADVNAGLSGGTLKIKEDNVIIQNLTFGPSDGDAMEVSGAKNVFITKCAFHDSSDELCSVVRESDFVTISWCKFYFDETHSHAFGGLIGNRDDRESDRGKLHVTMHHNWYAEGVRGRMPRVRFGHVHIYNNYYNSPDSGYCIGTGFECHIRLENSCFEEVKTPWREQKIGALESDGEIGWQNLAFQGCEVPTYIENKFPVFKPAYVFQADNVNDVKGLVIDPNRGAGNCLPHGESSDADVDDENVDSTKPRVVMMSDFPPIGVVKGGNVPNTMKSDPDDMQSIVRFLLYSNELEVEALIASAGTFAMEAHKKNILEVLDEYEKVHANLKTHDADYPTADHLRSITFEGKANNHGVNVKWGRNKQPWSDIMGEGLDSEASNAIIKIVDRPDPRPVWISVWGGPREVAQAIWDVKNTRSEAELKKFISKLRIFLIAYQDATHGWLMDEFPDLFIIDSRKTYQGMFGGRDPLSNLDWVNKHVRHDHGPLCDVYPHEGMGCTGVCEGDSPAFMHLISELRGLNDSEDPTQPSWGGQYKRKPGTNHYVDGPGGSSISRWRKDYQAEFKERADWCVERGDGSDASGSKE
jgi:pectate lyase